MATKEPIVFKVTGQNIKLIIDGETHARKIADAEERKMLKERVIAYNAKPLVKDKKELVKVMQVAKVETAKAKVNLVKKTDTKKVSTKTKEVIEAAPVLTQEQQIEAARKLLEANNFTVNAKQAPAARTYRGEH